MFGFNFAHRHDLVRINSFARVRLKVERSRETVNFKEQIMFKDKYHNMFLKSIAGYCVYYLSNIFLQQA